MYRSFFSVVLLSILSLTAHAQKDSTGSKQKYLYRIGVDIAKPMQLLSQDYFWGEAQLERINRKNGIMYLEGGAGSGSIDKSFLSYSTSGVFFRWGIAQNIVYRADFRDVETASIGVRYGGAWCRNSQVKYTVSDPIYGDRSEVQSARNMYRHWIEVNMGMKFRMFGPLFVGWTVRGAYKINRPDQNQVGPLIIPGFGKGDRTSSVGFNLYLSYLL